MAGESYLSLTIDRQVAYLSLNRPPANVMHIPMLQEMEGTLAALAGREDLKALVLRAEGKLFSAGVDVADHTKEKVGIMIPLFDRVCRTLAEFPLPTLAAVQGHALGGGCEVVICCDMAIIAQEARIGQPEIRLASMAPIAALRLPRMVGPANAAHLLFSGEQIGGQQAEAIGLVWRAVPRAELDQAVEEVLQGWRDLSAAALRINKRGLLIGQRGWSKPMDEMERLYLEELMATEDASEGLEAFLQKRAPVWRNR